MGVVCHSYGELGGDRNGDGRCNALGTRTGECGRMSGDAGALSKCEVKTLMASNHTAF